MRRLTLTLAALALPAMLAAPVLAGRCVITRSSSYVAPAASYKAVAVKHAAIVYPVYPYAAGYNPGYEQGYARGASEERLTQAVLTLTQRLAALEARLKAAPGEAPAPATPPPMPAPRDPFNPGREEARAPAGTQEAEGLAVLRASCASCHDPSRGAVKGGLTLTNGGAAVPLTCVQLHAVSRRVYLGEMPPKAPLSPEQTGAVMAWAATQRPRD